MTYKAQSTQNRCIRVFVSSTFRDMMGERDLLMTHAWPELRRFWHFGIHEIEKE